MAYTPTTTATDSIYTTYDEPTRTYPMSVLQNPDEFRDFIIWMCGVTDAVDAPDEEAWKKVRNRVKEVAAQYVLARRDLQAEQMREEQMRRQLEEQMQAQVWTSSAATTTSTSALGAHTPTISGAGISGATTYTIK